MTIGVLIAVMISIVVGVSLIPYITGKEANLWIIYGIGIGCGLAILFIILRSRGYSLRRFWSGGGMDIKSRVAQV
jgi:hypothetical protein